MQDRLTLDADPAALARLNDWLAARFSEAGLAPAVAADMKLCLNEAVTNTICHGFDDPAGARIAVELQAGPRRAVALVTDNGRPFDPLAAPLAAPIESLRSAQIGGFGIKLMRDTASALHYERVGDTNRLRIECSAD
ncbi:MULTISPECIES: ATP-binding protein [unclassified Roseitalea]|uniref:ATP-binding protein n=1 Tax=unclassified Roseitalea TaxID=2639107 RepID=UPI00273F0CD0|nr:MULTISPECIES: ATP-binding protein [unclassified Roseitalea]